MAFSFDEMEKPRLKVFCTSCHNVWIKRTSALRCPHPKGGNDKCPSFLSGKNGSVLWRVPDGDGDGSTREEEFQQICRAKKEEMRQLEEKKNSCKSNRESFMVDFPNALATKRTEKDPTLYGFGFVRNLKSDQEPWIYPCVRGGGETVVKGRLCYSFDEAKQVLAEVLAEHGLEEDFNQRKQMWMSRQLHGNQHVHAATLVPISSTEQNLLEQNAYKISLVRCMEHFTPTGEFMVDPSLVCMSRDDQEIMKECFRFVDPVIRQQEKKDSRLFKWVKLTVENFKNMLEAYPTQMLFWGAAKTNGTLAGTPTLGDFENGLKNSRRVFMFPDFLQRDAFLSNMSPSLELYTLQQNPGAPSSGRGAFEVVEFDLGSEETSVHYSGHQLPNALLQVLGFSTSAWKAILVQENRRHSILPLHQDVSLDDNEKFLCGVGDLIVTIQVRGTSQLVLAGATENANNNRTGCKVVMKERAIWAMQGDALTKLTHAVIPGGISRDNPVPLVPEGPCTVGCQKCSMSITVRYLSAAQGGSAAGGGAAAEG